ncbi:hypothetical protein E1162_18100 [Rhodobacteraceae bacterium RKSG542]|uniref:hypothetical protein n=1 Tax=Pseudovibrio flavus TaxID=2529854 RepID=UPI0012BC811D|nr:hypothetical protein [Pseudovibrio flavus]MTI19159.1 hypothetical protein [Pseudovibrio flavus]
MAFASLHHDAHCTTEHTSFGDKVKNFFEALYQAQVRSRVYPELLKLDDKLLANAGFSREELLKELHR